MEAFEAYLLDLKDQYKSFYYHILKSGFGSRSSYDPPAGLGFRMDLVRL